MVVTTEYCEVLYVEADHMRRIYEVTLHYDVLHSAILLMCTPYVTHCVCINQHWLGVTQCYAMLCNVTSTAGAQRDHGKITSSEQLQ